MLKKIESSILLGCTPRNPGEFLAYGVLYAVGQNVEVGEVGNLFERLVAPAHHGKSFGLLTFFLLCLALGFQCIKKGDWMYCPAAF